MSSDQTITCQPATEHRRVVATVTREIAASPQRIFPLVCPVEELKWIPDWDYQLIYSNTGVKEDCEDINRKKADNRVVTVKELGAFWHDLQTAEHQN